MDKLYFWQPEYSLKNEARFTTWFGKQCKNRWYFFFKISDADKRIKPFDAFGMIDGTPVAIEFKVNDNNSCFPYRMLKGSSSSNPWWQVKGLFDYQKNSWYSLIIVYNRKKNKYIIVNLKDIDFNTKVDI